MDSPKSMGIVIEEVSSVNRVAEKLLLVLVLLLSISLLAIAWATAIYQPNNIFWDLLSSLVVGQTILLAMVVALWLIKGTQNALGLWLLSRFQSHAMYIFLLLEFAFAIGVITATGYSYSKPSAAVLLSLLAVLGM